MDSKEIKKINQAYLIASNKLDNGDYLGALKVANIIKNNFKPNYFVSDVLSCLFIDIGNALEDEKVIKEGIDLLLGDFELIVKNEKNPASAYYNLSNGYASLFRLKHKTKPYFNCFKETELDNVKINLRKALKLDSKKPEIYVNLANCYDHLGRTFDALECYEKALDLEPNHSMALGNKGIALCKYAFLLGRNYRTILIDAHYFISKALKIGVNPESKDSFITWKKWIERQFYDRNKLKKYPNFPGYDIDNTKSSINKYIIEYNMKNQLYLNVCTFCQKCNASIGDNINIDSEILKIDSKVTDNFSNRLSLYLDQIKEDYISARLLLSLSRYDDLNLDYVYEDTVFSNVDNSVHDAKLQLLRLSFKNFFDILDKIAYFINDILKLEIPEWWIDYRKLWYSQWNGKPENSIIHNKFISTSSYGLNALFDIHWDFEKDGPYNNLRMIRNALTHRVVIIKTYCAQETPEEMCEETFVNETIKLAKILRNAIFYLMYYVQERRTGKLNS